MIFHILQFLMYQVQYLKKKRNKFYHFNVTLFLLVNVNTYILLSVVNFDETFYSNTPGSGIVCAT